MHPIRKQREKRGLSREKAAVLSGLSYSMWTKMERGERVPSFSTMSAVASVLGWTTAELIDALEGAGSANHSSHATQSA